MTLNLIEYFIVIVQLFNEIQSETPCGRKTRKKEHNYTTIHNKAVCRDSIYYILPTNFQKIMSQYAAGSDKYISNCIALNCHMTLMQYAVILVTNIYHLLVIEKIVGDAIGTDKHFKLYYIRL